MKSAEVIQGMVDRGSLDTVQSALGDKPQTRGVLWFKPDVLPGTPELPAPGIYFGMDDATYHALPALSNSGIKKLAASPMIFWASTPWLSPKKRKQVEESADEKAHQIFGRAYHCRLMEGASAYAMRFAVELTPEDCPDCLESTDQIKAAIGQFQTASTLKKDPPGTMVPVKPWSKVEDFMPGTGESYQRSAVKADWIRQLMELDPDAQVFAIMEAQHEAAHPGKVFLTADQHVELEVAAAMIERDPECKDAFVGGFAEVVLIWYCPRTGVPMKAKVDYLKLTEMVDLKSVDNRREISMVAAALSAIGSYRYNLQPVVYFEGAEAVRKIIRAQGIDAIHVCGEPDAEISEEVAFALKWAKQKDKDEWLWIFQAKGDAPITRGVRFPREGDTFASTQYIVDYAKKRFLQFSEVFGTEPWLDIAPVYTLNDGDLPRYVTELSE